MGYRVILQKAFYVHDSHILMKDSSWLSLRFSDF